MTDYTVLPTPAGPLTLLARGDVLVAGAFAPVEQLAARVGADDVRERADLGALSKAVEAYLDGDLAALDDVPVAQAGTPFQHRVWQVLRTVPAGTTVAYGELAAELGVPGGARAVGSACARNLVVPVVPCHRVVRAGEGLGGYAYGLTAKQWLLAHERAHRRG